MQKTTVKLSKTTAILAGVSALLYLTLLVSLRVYNIVRYSFASAFGDILGDVIFLLIFGAYIVIAVGSLVRKPVVAGIGLCIAALSNLYYTGFYLYRLFTYYKSLYNLHIISLYYLPWLVVGIILAICCFRKKIGSAMTWVLIAVLATFLTARLVLQIISLVSNRYYDIVSSIISLFVPIFITATDCLLCIALHNGCKETQASNKECLEQV